MIIPIPTFNERDEAPTRPDYKWVKWYLNCLPWKCQVCAATMFGRMTYCVYCKMKLHTHTPRPTDYVENVFNPSSAD